MLFFIFLDLTVLLRKQYFQGLGSIGCSICRKFMAWKSEFNKIKTCRNETNINPYRLVVGDIILQQQE